MPIFSADDLDRLARPHVARGYFLEADLPSGVARFHNGVGTVTAGGQEWKGITDPLGTQMVSLSSVTDPRFGVAASVNISISGANAAFFKSMYDTGQALEGRDADLYWAAFDGESQQILIGPNRIFRGKLSSPAIKWSSIGIRLVTITLESIWEAQNYPFGGRWNDADQQRRYAGDKGLQYVGQDVQEQWA